MMNKLLNFVAELLGKRTGVPVVHYEKSTLGLGLNTASAARPNPGVVANSDGFNALGGTFTPAHFVGMTNDWSTANVMANSYNSFEDLDGFNG